MMTFEEFKNLALNPPKTNEPAIFRLKVLHIGGLPEHRKTHYPKYKVYEHSTYIFKSVEDAEKVIFSLSEKEDSNIYAFYLYEIPFERAMFEELNCLSCRAYDSNGKLVEQTRCSGMWDEKPDEKYSKFRGRPANNVRFKKGDIVEVYDGRDEVQLAVIVSIPVDIEWSWNYRIRCIEGMKKDCPEEELTDTVIEKYFRHDMGDDCYIVIDGPGYYYHSHINSIYVFKPLFPIRSHIRHRFERYYNSLLEEDKKLQNQKNNNDETCD